MKARHAAVSLSVIGLTAAGLTALPAQAGLTTITRCVGTGGAVTVEGDLFVPKGKSCLLEGTTVTGTVRVGPDADLVTTDATLMGRVAVRENGYLDASDTELGGPLVSRGGYGVYLGSSTVAGTLRATAPNDVELKPLVVVDDSTVRGNLRSEAGQLLVEDSHVRGNVRSSGDSTDVLNSTLGKRLAVTGNVDGSYVCESEVLGNARYEDNGPVQLGSGSVLEPCDDGINYWGGHVTINGSTGGVELGGNIVQGNLRGDGNDPAPVASDNRVRGNVRGQFATAAPAAPAAFAAKGKQRTLGTSAEAAAETAVSDRTTEVLKEATSRKDAAVAAARKAGSADL